MYDYKEIWNTDSTEQITETVDIDEIRLFELAKKKGYILTKEKELTSLADQSNDVNPKNKSISSLYHDTTENGQCQDSERYTLEQIRHIFDYDTMIKEYPDRKQDIDSAIGILYNSMNTSRSTLRISGVDKPAKLVISKLMKLDKELIMYAINKFSGQTERIKNSTAYMLTILYYAPEQSHLEKKNQANSDQAKTDHRQG